MKLADLGNSSESLVDRSCLNSPDWRVGKLDEECERGKAELAAPGKTSISGVVQMQPKRVRSLQLSILKGDR